MLANFQHLSCYLPGLFTLAAHTLPLTPRDKQLHEWAAKGLANTCWFTYADQASGLSPDEMMMEPWPGPAHAGRWIDHVEAWEKEGNGGLPPGLYDVDTNGNRDYYPKKFGYLLRPEVCCIYLLLVSRHRLSILNRQWKAFTFYGGQLATKSGESEGGPFLKQLRSMLGQSMGTQV